MTAITVVSTKTNKLMKNILLIISILFVRRIKKTRRPLNTPMIAPNQGSGLKYHQRMNPPTSKLEVIANFLDLVAGFIVSPLGIAKLN
jgi:hypothetical protein